MNAQPAILIGASIPRSGHHFLERTLQRYFGSRMHYCEFYTPRHCCRQIPCTKRGAFDVIFQKNHDHDMALDRSIPGVTYVIQHRHPVPNMASGWELSSKPGIGAISNEYRATRDHFAWWLAQRAIYYRRFHDKWAVGQPAHALRIDYDDLSRDTARQVAAVIRAAAGTVDEVRLAAAVEASGRVRATAGVPFTPRRVDVSALPCPALAAAFEEHVLRHGPAFGYAAMLGGGYEGSLLQGLILADDPAETVPPGFATREDAVEALAGHHPEMRLRRGRALLDARRPAEAAALLETLLAASPHFIAAWQPLLRAWDEAGLPAKPAMVTAEAMFGAMHDPATVLALASFWRDQGRLLPAAAALHAAIGLHPGRAAGLRTVLATILEPLGRRPEAIAQLEAALAADPADQVAQSMLDRLRPPHRR